MATEEHQQLSSFVKNVHQKLRSRAQEVGADEAWKEHCLKDGVLQEYAIAMQTLASKFWKENAADESKQAQCRIEWVVNKCMGYFLGTEQEKYRVVESEKMKKLCNLDNNEQNTSEIKTLSSGESKLSNYEEANLTLLDVGSCYNPFKVYPFFKVVPVDIAPATPDVYHCDFLNLNVFDFENREYFKDLDPQVSITELPSNAFDVVVFSLLLEYFPSPEQRYSCASKSYNLLKPEGLLFIITPDSKHSSANAPLMKHWRIVLGQIGFSRIYYEKLPHIHCMAFRKEIHPEIPRHWVCLNISKQKLHVCKNSEGISNNGLYIPQDFQEIQESDDLSKTERTSEDDDVLAEMFLELPVIDFE